jgi:uncharacterized coiled-coil protein SlyX
MNAAELTVEMKGLDERTSNLQRLLEMQEKTVDEMRKSVEQLGLTVAKLQQQVADHIAHVEKWDARRWTTIGFFIAALISLVANLVVVMVRK